MEMEFNEETPPPIPGMRPPLGSPGGPVPAPKSSMGFVMPIYTICIIVFFVYTLTKILFRRTAAPYDPVIPDPQFRRRVFRDDSRTSPEKLGKKEADTIVTAISGLVAEVQQQMEASGAPTQQRQDVQDNARPYTNGTILLNSGPVQIVTSEYKETSKEKTPEPVSEKESIPEPKEADPIKVPCSEMDELTKHAQDITSEVIEPSPEVTLEENKATTETVVIRQSSPDQISTEETSTVCDEPTPEIKETSPEPEPIVAQDPIPEPVPELPVTSSESRSVSEANFESEPDSTVKTNEPTLESQILQEDLSTSSPNVVDLECTDFVLISDPKETSSNLKEQTPELKELSPEILEVELKELSSKESSPANAEPKEILEPLLKHEEPSPLNTDPSRELIELSSEPHKLSSQSDESITEPKESIAEISNEPISIPQTISDLTEFSLKSEESANELKPIPPVSDEPTSDPSNPEFGTEEPTSKLKELTPDIKESNYNECIPSIIDSAHEPEITVPENLAIEQSTPDLKESTPEPTEHPLEVQAPIVEYSSQPEITEHSPKLDAPLGSSLESALIECTREVDSPGIERHFEQRPESSELKEPTPQSKETTPEPIPKTNQTEEFSSVPEGTMLDLEEAIADVDDSVRKPLEEESKDIKPEQKKHEEVTQKDSDVLLKAFEGTDAINEVKDDLLKTNEAFLDGERFVLVEGSSPDEIEDKKLLDEDDIENAAVKVVTMETTAHPADGGQWPREQQPPPPASPAPPQPRTPGGPGGDEVKSIFLQTEIPQQSRVLVAQYHEDRPPPATHSPSVVSGKMTLSLIQDAPRETPERDPESTLDEFTTASAVTQPAAEKGEIESDEEIDEEIEVEEIELEEEELEEEEEEEPPPATKSAGKK